MLTNTQKIFFIYKKEKKTSSCFGQIHKMGNPSHLERVLLRQGFHRAAQATPESDENLVEMILAKRNVFWEPHLLPSKYGFFYLRGRV